MGDGWLLHICMCASGCHAARAVPCCAMLRHATHLLSCCFLTTPQVDELVAVAQRALAEGMCVVVGLQSTGEAGTEQHAERNGTDLDEL